MKQSKPREGNNGGGEPAKGIVGNKSQRKEKTHEELCNMKTISLKVSGIVETKKNGIIIPMSRTESILANNLIQHGCRTESDTDLKGNSNQEPIEAEDFGTLKGNGWLNDQIINCYMYLLF